MDNQAIRIFKNFVLTAGQVLFLGLTFLSVLLITSCATVSKPGDQALSAVEKQSDQPSIPTQKPKDLPSLPVFEPAQLTARVDPVLDFSVSSKGSKIAITSSSKDFAAIWLQSGDPNQVQLPSRLLPAGSDHFQPAFLPDGSGLVYVGTEHDVKGDLFLIEIKNSKKEPTRLTGRETSDRAPCLSPNGQKIYFHQHRPGKAHREIAVLDTENLNKKPTILDIPQDAAYPAISPNGKKCAFVSAGEKGNSIYLFDLESKELNTLTQGDFGDKSPCWSENGDFIYFTRCLDSGKCSLWRIALNKNRPQAYPVTSGSFSARNPSLANGRLYFLSDKAGLENVWYLPAQGQIPVQETAEAQMRLAQNIKNLYPPDLHLTILAYQKVRETFANQKEVLAEATLRAARLYERLNQNQYAGILYQDCANKIGIQPQAGLAAIRLAIIQAKADWNSQVTNQAKREVLNQAQEKLQLIANKHQSFPNLLAESKIEQAELLIELGATSKDLVQALDLMEIVLEDKTTSQDQRARALLIKAKVFDQVGRKDSVIPIYAKILEQFPEVQPWADQAVQRILDFQLSGADQQAIQEQVQVLGRIADTYRSKLPRLAMGAHNRIGDIYFEIHEWAKAKAAYRQVLETFKADPSTQYAAARLALAEILYREGRYYEALQLYESEMAVRAFEDYLYRLAWNGYIRKNLEAAEHHFTLGEVSRAKTMFFNLIRKDPTLVEAHRGYIKSAAAQKKIKSTLQAYRQRLKEDPKNPVLLYCTGLSLTYLEDKKSLNQAKQLIGQALRIKGQVEFFHQTLGYIHEVLETVHQEKGQLELALEYYRKAYFLNDPDQNPRNQANLLLNLGNVCFLLKNYEQAFENYNLREQSQIPFQNKDTELLFYRRYAQAAFLSNQGQEPVEALAKGLDLIDQRLQPKQASVILGRLHRYIKEQILLPSGRQGLDKKLLHNLFERQSQIHSKLFQASKKDINPPPDPSWEIYRTSLKPMIEKQNELILDLEPVVRQMDDQNWGSARQNMLFMLKQARQALEFPLNLRVMQSEMLDRLGLAYQEIDQWAKARQRFLEAFELNQELGQIQNLAVNRRSAGYNAYLQASQETGQKRRKLLNQALADFQEVIALVDKYGVPALKKDQRKKGLISISLDIALEKQTASQAQYGFSAEQEKRLARAFISRIQTELGRLQPARLAAEEQLKSYPSGKDIPEEDIFGVSLLLHRSAQLETALDHPDLAGQRFLRSARLALEMGNPISSAINLSNAAQTLSKSFQGTKQEKNKLTELSRLDQQTKKLLAKKARLIGSVTVAGYHNQMGVAWASLALNHDSNQVKSAATAATFFTRAGTHFYQGLKTLAQGNRSKRNILSLEAALHLNLADLAAWNKENQTAKDHFQKALELADKGCLACFKWRALAGLGRFEEAVQVLNRVPLFERSCGPSEVLDRLAALYYRLVRQGKPEQAFNLLEKLSELERVQRMTPLALTPLSDEAKDNLRKLRSRLSTIKDLENRLKSAKDLDQDYLRKRLQQEQQLLESNLNQERTFSLSLLESFRNKERRDIFLQLAGLSAEMLHLSEKAAQKTKNSQSNQEVQEYDRLADLYAQKLDQARLLLSPEEPAGLLGLLVPAPVQAADVAAVLPQGGKALRLLPAKEHPDVRLSIVLSPSTIEILELRPDQDLEFDGPGPNILIYEHPDQSGLDLGLIMALSGTHLVRSIDNKKPFKNKVLSYPKPIKLPEPFTELSIDPGAKVTDIAKLTERAHSLMADTDVGRYSTVPTRQGQLPETYPGMSLDQGQHLNLIQLADRLDNVSLGIFNQASLEEAYTLGHLFGLFGLPTVLLPRQEPGSDQNIQEFFNQYAQNSVSGTLKKISNNQGEQKSPWLHLGHWGLNEKEASALARQRFTRYVKSGVQAYEKENYNRALVLFENGLLVVNQMPALSKYKAKLLEYARESAFAAGDMKRAAEQAEDLSLYWSQHDPDSQSQAQALIKQGLVLSRLEKFDQAVACLQQAVEILSELDLPLERIQALSDLGTVLENATEYDKALQGYETAASISQEMGASELLARQQMSIGRIYDLRLSRYALAKEYYLQAEKIFQDLGLKAESLQAQLDIARCDRLLGRFDRTEGQLSSILEKAKALSGTKRLQTKIILEQANSAWFQAHYQKAFNLLQNCLDQARENDWLLEQVIALNTSGLTWWTLGKNDRSLRDLNRALNLAKTLDIRRDEVATTYNNIGLVMRDQKKFDQALNILHKALAIDQEIGSKWAIAYDLRNIGLTHVHKGEPQQAMPLLEQALSLTIDIGNTINQAKVLVAMGNCHLQLGQTEPAKERFEQALRLSRKMALRETVWRSLYGLGLIYKQQGILEKARKQLTDALDVIEQMRADIQITQLRDSFVADKMEVYEALVSVLLNMGQEAEAFYTAERSRARNLIDLLGNRKLRLGKGQDQELFDRINSLKASILEQEKLVAQAEDKEARTIYQKTLDNLEDRYKDLLLRIQAEKPELASLVTVDPLSAKEVANLLDSEVTLLSYYLLPEEIVCWILSSTKIELVRVPVKRSHINDLILEFRRTLQNLEPYEAKAKELSSLLVEPVAEHFSQANQIGIVPHRMLHYLSFAPLDFKSSFLVETHPLFYLPSASVLRYTLKRRMDKKNPKVLAIGNPALDNPQLELPFAEHEVQSIGWNFSQLTKLMREEATEGWLVDNVHRYQVVHIASHGKYEPLNPLFSSLKLANDPREDGDLKAAEVFGLKIQADMVVLSACQSGLGDIQAGDEVVGLNRAFMFAGTHTMVSSLWRVSDISTAILMKQFYREYLRTDKASSLRRAMLHVKSYYPHPGYWSAFILTGDYF